MLSDRALLDIKALASPSETRQVARVVGSGHFGQLAVPHQVNAMIDGLFELLPTGGRD